MKSKSVVAAILALGLSSLALSVQATEGPLVYQEDLSLGIDGAFKSAFAKATASIAAGESVDLSVEEMMAMCQNVAIFNDKLDVSFDAAKIKQTLNTMGISSWAGMDEPVILWLCVDGNIVGAGDNNAFVQELKAKAQERHYQIMLPLMDIDDIQAVSYETILNNDMDKLAKASKRYGNSFIISAKVATDSEGKPQASFNVFDHKAQILDKSVSAGETAASEMARHIADTLKNNTQNTATASATDYFELGPGQDFVRILISNVQNVVDYDKITSSLVSFGYSAHSPIVARTGEGIIVEVKASSGAEILDGTLAHSGTFTKTASWTYTYNKSAGEVRADRGGIEKGLPNLIRSSFEVEAQAAH